MKKRVARPVERTVRKPKGRLVTKAHRQEQVENPLEFDDVKKVMARAARPAPKGTR